MARNPRLLDHNCGVEATVGVIGGKWKARILHQLWNGTTDPDSVVPIG